MAPLPVSIVFGLLSALCWGVADFLVARVGDRVGTFATFAHAQVAGLAALTAAVLALESPLSLSPSTWAALAGVGVVGAAAYLLLYAALQVGPVAITSPVASTNGAVAAVLGVVLLGEALGARGVAGLVLVTIGVVGASVDLSGVRRSLRGDVAVLPGAVLAAGAAAGLGSMLFLLKVVGADVSLLVVVFAVRAVGTLASAPLFAAGARVGRSTLPWMAAIGLVDSAAFVSFVVGVRAGRVAVVSPLSSLFAVVTVVLAYAFIHEPIGRAQKVGIALVFLGVPLLASA